MPPAVTTYEQVLIMTQQLTSTDKLRLLETLAASVREELSTHRRRSILELQGLGKELWQQIDVESYLQQERAAWDG